MKNSFFVLGAALLASANVHAASSFQGSDTLSGLITDAIIASGMDKEIVYTGGGSGKGETALVNGEQGIAPMSREMKPEAIELGKKSGVEFATHVLALDGLGIFVNAANSLPGMDLATIGKIFTCEITQWEQVPGSNRSGTIEAFRRNDFSGTTDTFKSLVGVKNFGACVQVMAETIDIAEKTSAVANAIGYSGHSAKREGNRTIAVAQNGGSFVELNVNTVRNGSYPLARKLYVFEATGARQANETEAKFLSYLLDRSFLDPIVQDNEFYTID